MMLASLALLSVRDNKETIQNPDGVQDTDGVGVWGILYISFS